ncbi:MAG: hypothetical protein GF398_10580 [Chitinivibrionales bacterium]|nr:hypothetical protein [Chitinivibrionales bacterium]
MDGVSSVAQSVQAMNQIMKTATEAGTEMAEKLVKVNAEMALGGPKIPGVGENIDVAA